MTRFIPVLLSLFFSATIIHSQSYYVQLDSDCLDRYEFVTDIDKSPYVVYTSKLNDGSTTQLDIGKEQVKWIQTLPAKMISCASLPFDKAMTLAVNNSTVKIYIVRKSPTHYHVSPVEKATFIAETNTTLEVTMADADFVLDWDRLYSNRNLATPASTKEVFLEGTIKYHCETGYIIRKKNDLQTESFKEYTIIPALGVINKRSAPDATAITNSLKLNRINDTDFVDYLTAKCPEVEDETFTKPVSYNETIPVTSPAYDQFTDKGGEIPVSYNSGPCPPPSRAGVHVVLKGETLYSISRRYGLSVDQLKTMNGIGKNNTISICQELIISQVSNQATPSQPTGSTTTNKTIDQNKYHIVKPNETVSQLAAMYGYTEKRFRQMNSLGTFERVYAGQKVFTSDCDCPNTEGVPSDIPQPFESVETERLTSRGNPDVYFRPIKVHRVKSGESLFAIARQYDTTVDRIRELNGLDKNSKLNKDQKVYVQ
ncbi:MAG: LysM peptidoglycan-binding domain-containing protein [Bacteroidota bacterium]